MYLCQDTDDVHGSYPHRIVIPVSSIIVHRERKTVIGSAFIICALCEHWNARLATQCSCICHREYADYGACYPDASQVD